MRAVPPRQLAGARAEAPGEGGVARVRRACRLLIPDPSPTGAKDEGAPIFDSEFS
jgi:hypothetical protein